MSYCPKCGNKITEDMTFCPKCGAPLKAEQAPTEAKPVVYRRDEKSEKDEGRHEKREKAEKSEKHEKRGYGFLGPLVGGLVLLVLGSALFLEIMGYTDRRFIWAFFFVIIGVIIIFGAIYGAVMASRRHPRP